MRSLPLYLGLALAVGACATVSDLKATLDATKSCCATYAEMQFRPVRVEETLDVNLNQGSPVYFFDTGKSYFQALELPPQATGRTLRIMASPTGSVGLEAQKWAQVYCPRVLFLNSSLSPIAVHEQLPDFQRGSLFGGDHGFISDAPIPPESRFAILYANPHTFGTMRSLTTRGGTYSVGGALVIDRGGESISYPCAPIASARVRIK